MENGNLVYPGRGAFSISTGTYTSSTVPFAKATRSIYVGVTGDLKVIMYDGSTGLFPAAPVGLVLPIRAIALSSGNGAGSLTGIY
jgi:hypothetical protein